MLDLHSPFAGPVQLTIAGDYLERYGAHFNPHGFSYWVDENGDIFIYVISHWPEGDSVEVFQYFHEILELVHIKSLRHPLIFQLNNIYAVGQDEFYATNYHSSSWFPLKVLDYAITRPAMYVLYFNKRTGEVKQAITGLYGPNGIALSTNGRCLLLY